MLEAPEGRGVSLLKGERGGGGGLRGIGRGWEGKGRGGEGGQDVPVSRLEVIRGRRGVVA